MTNGTCGIEPQRFPKPLPGLNGRGRLHPRVLSAFGGRHPWLRSLAPPGQSVPHSTLNTCPNLGARFRRARLAKIAPIASPGSEIPSHLCEPSAPKGPRNVAKGAGRRSGQTPGSQPDHKMSPVRGAGRMRCRLVLPDHRRTYSRRPIPRLRLCPRITRMTNQRGWGHNTKTFLRPSRGCSVLGGRSPGVPSAVPADSTPGCIPSTLRA